MPGTPEPGPKVMRGLLEAFVLESLARGPKHGYALLREMEATFGAEPNKNLLYPMLHDLAERGLVLETEDGSSKRDKRTYALTPQGNEELDAYRRLPGGFRDAILRVWAPQHANAPGPLPAPAREAPRDAARLPVTLTVAPPGSSKPYPCAEARVALTKDARSGDVEVRLTGCPMGSFPYCPECPVFASVQGLRALLFG